MPAAPDLSIDALIIERRNQLQRAKLVPKELQALTASARSRTLSDRMVEVVTGTDGGQQLHNNILQSAEQEIVCLIRPPVIFSRLDLPQEEDQLIQRKAQARGVAFRSIVDRSMLDLPGMVRRLWQDIDAGEQIRMMIELPLKLIVAPLARVSPACSAPATGLSFDRRLRIQPRHRMSRSAQCYSGREPPCSPTTGSVSSS